MVVEAVIPFQAQNGRGRWLLAESVFSGGIMVPHSFLTPRTPAGGQASLERKPVEMDLLPVWGSMPIVQSALPFRTSSRSFLLAPRSYGKCTVSRRLAARPFLSVYLRPLQCQSFFGGQAETQ